MHALIAFILFGFQAQAFDLDDIYREKRSAFEKLWEVSMGRLEVQKLEGELHVENWDTVRQGSRGIKEVATLIIQDERTGNLLLSRLSMGDKSSSTTQIAAPTGFQIMGKFHTHPYEYESLKDLSFSVRDLVDLYLTKKHIQLRTGFVSLIKTGEKYFGLVVEDEKLALDYFKAQESLAQQDRKTIFDYLYQKFYSVNRGRDIQEIQLNSFIHILGNSEAHGLGLYEAKEGLGWKKLN